MNATEPEFGREVNTVIGNSETLRDQRPHLSLKERQRKEREELILSTAEEVFLEKGFHDTSIDEIAVRVGVAKGTIYLHFPGKEELVLAIFARDMQSLLQEIDTIINADQYRTPRAKLEAVLSYMHTGLFHKQAQLLATIYNGVDLKRKIMEKGCVVHKLWDGAVTRISGLLEQGKAAGDFDPNIPTQIMVMTIFSIFSPRSYHQLLLGDSISSDELVKHLMHICFEGIGLHKNT